MEGSTTLVFLDSWLWSIFVVVGLLMILTELIVGVETGLGLVIVGSILVLSGLVTIPFHSWVVTAVSASVLCVVYFFFGRRFIHLRRWKGEIRTGADALIGESGIMTHPITKITDGSVKVRNQEWRAGAEEDINEGEEIVVVGIRGTTLIVKKEGGDMK